MAHCGAQWGPGMGNKRMWHIETDFFALAIFFIMYLKERQHRKENQDLQAKTFYTVLLVSIANDIIDIISSTAMNDVTNWWVYEIFMTIYVMSMPLLAAVWVGYAYVLIHKDDRDRKTINRDILLMLIPYGIYALLAMTNPWNSLFFRLTTEMEYSRGPLFMSVGVGSIMFYSALGLILVLANWRRIVPRSNAVLLMAFFLVTGCFIWVQLANPGWLIINASYAIVYVWCDFTVEEQRRSELYQEINRKNKELEIVAKRAESAAQAKTEFLSRMSHDIRTPMNAIIGLTHLARKEERMDVVQDYLKNIETSSDFLLGLINDILDMSKIENGELTLSERPMTKAAFAGSIDTVIRPLMDERNIHFEMKLEDSLTCIQADPLRFNQIFFNLLSNAAKFTPKGGHVVFRSEDLPPKGGKKGIRLYVQDNGIGMSREYLTHIYDPFSQERSALGDSSVGTGLGLPIVKSLVEIMGGTISVTSEQGVGTEFVVELYVKEAQPEAANPKTEQKGEGLEGMRILLVEDNELNTYVARIVLENAGCLVDTAGNGQEALDRFAASQMDYYDAILMDVRMPVMDGIEATRQIRSLKRSDAAEIPIIAMTADAFAEEKKRTLEAGMNCHLSKPIDPQQLYSALSEYITRRRQGVRI